MATCEASTPQTSNIDGESDLKVRKAPPQLYSRLQGKTQDEIHQVLNSLSLEIFCGRPDCHLYQFDARYENRWNAMQFVHRPVHERQSFRAEPASAGHPAAIHAIRVPPPFIYRSVDTARWCTRGTRRNSGRTKTPRSRKSRSATT